jgi:surfactin family lipopeptide synthetase A
MHDESNPNSGFPESNTARDVYVFPMSFAQQRLWFLDQLEPGSIVYNTPFVVSLAGALKCEALKASLKEIVRRHEVLRAQFRLENGRPIQVIDARTNLEVPVVDLSDVSLADREDRVLQLAAEEARTPFNLAAGPMVRARLLRLGGNEHVLLLTTHHIVFDGWSRSIFLRELASLYQAFSKGQQSPLPELPLQYTDFSVWQNEYVKGEVLQKQIAYWKEKLATMPSALELPTDRPRPAVSTFRGDSLASFIPKELTAKLRGFSQQQGVTLFMATLAVFQMLLARYSGQEDIAVGSPIAGRNRKEIEELIGFFANTLVLRSDLSGDPSFRDLLNRVRETALGAYAHQDIPFEKLVEEIQPERSLSHNPLFQVLFAFRNVPSHQLTLDGLELKLLRGDRTTSKFELGLFVSEINDGLGLRWEYNCDLFDPETITRMSEHFALLLQSSLAEPDRPISKLPLLGESERRQSTVEWNSTAAEYPRDKCVHELFELQVARTPDAFAVSFRDQRLTYSQLNERANQLAHYLARRGIERGERIGIYIERSLEMMIALLAVQKAGAVYVPLDPDYPRDRIDLILQDADVKWIVSQNSLVSSIPSCSATFVCLDTDWPGIQNESRENPAAGGKSDDLIYVIFTSGSTGRPKGVQVPHRAVVNLLSFMAEELSVGAGDVFPALASFAFDMCIPELYLALIRGGQVAIGEPEINGNGEELARWLSKVGATIVHATPTMWRLLMDAGFTGKGLKRVIGAEPFPQELCDRLLEADPCLYNFYGPTETTVWSTMQELRLPGEQITIGRPIANTRTYLLDKNLQPVPVGVAAEIYIAGDGVTRGYLKQPDLTQAKFLPDPFVQDQSARMYRTGDMGRYLPDGRIQFLGRSDHQVKVRGFRIELGEIESVLLQQDTVEAAVVTVREDFTNDRRLVAYVVAARGSTMNKSDLRTALRQRLPDYMVPSVVVLLDNLPLSSNGKVDRRALPAPEDRDRERTNESETPASSTERQVAAIWSEVLRHNHLGLHDNFFELGGHSLMATQVISRIRMQFSCELPLRTLFEHPTIAGLAQILDAGKVDAIETDEPALRPVSRQAFHVKRLSN